MKFHIKHLHTPERCPAVNDDVAGTFGRMMQAERQIECGIEVIGAWIDAPGHVVYIVVEAADALSVQKWLWHGLGVGTAETVPVIVAEEAMQLAEDAS